MVGVTMRDGPVPNAIREHGYRVVGWNYQEIRDAINEAAEYR